MATLADLDKVVDALAAAHRQNIGLDVMLGNRDLRPQTSGLTQELLDALNTLEQYIDERNETELND